MSRTDRDRIHVSAERIQALLDGALGEPEERTAREHLSTCARCRSELEAWTTLYRRLGSLAELAPSPGFSGRVLDALPSPEPERLPLAARIRAWLTPGRKVEPVAVRGHVEAPTIQELLDGALPPARTAAMEAHLAGCRLCREEVEQWRGLMVRLDRIPRLEPSPAFAERVMAHVRVQTAAAIARPGLGERVAAWIALNPRTRKRLAAFAGAAVTPVVSVALMAWTVFSHPLVTPANLVSFLWLKAQGLVTGVAGGVWTRISGNATAFELYSLVEPLTRSAEAAAAAATLLGGLTVAAVWILYRNVIAANPAENGYARLPV